MGVVMRYYLCPLACKFWWEHCAGCVTEAFSDTCAVHIEDCECWWLLWLSVRTSQEPGVWFSVTANFSLSFISPHNNRFWFYSSSYFNSQLNSIIISSNFHHSIHPPPSPPPSPMTFLYRVPFPDQWSSWDPDSRVSHTVFYLNYYCMATGRFYQKLVVEKCHKLSEICGSPTTLMWTLQQLQFWLQNLMNMRAYSCSVAFQQ